MFDMPLADSRFLGLDAKMVCVVYPNACTYFLRPISYPDQHYSPYASGDGTLLKPRFALLTRSHAIFLLALN